MVNFIQENHHPKPLAAKMITLWQEISQAEEAEKKKTLILKSNGLS